MVTDQAQGGIVSKYYSNASSCSSPVRIYYKSEDYVGFHEVSVINWIWNPLTIEWKEVKPKIEGSNYKVVYSDTELIGQGWDKTITPEEGTHKYQIKIKTSTSEPIESPRGVDLHRISIKGSHNHDISNTAGAYIDVPYVLGNKPGEVGWPEKYGDYIGKQINPLNGNDCSGLAFCAGYNPGDEPIGDVNVADLKEHFWVSSLTIDDRETGDLLFANKWKHVGIYYKTDDPVQPDHVIHASSGAKEVVKGIMTKWWIDNFCGLGSHIL